jgi:hypothetical protein
MILTNLKSKAEEKKFESIFKKFRDYVKKRKCKPLIISDFLEQHIDRDKEPDLFERFIDELSDKLDYLPEYGLSYETETGQLCYYYLPEVYKGARFLVKPTEEEIDRGILIPGHRFLPFINIEFTPLGASVFDGRRQIPVKTEQISIEELKPAVSYYPMPMPEYLIDDGNTLEVYSDYSDDDLVTIGVYDLTSFYKKHKFKYGDSIIFKLKDFVKGVLEISYKSAEEHLADMGSILRWVALMDEGLKRSLDVFRYMAFADDQLNFAYLAESDFLLNNPVIDIPGFLQLSKNIHISYINDNAVFSSNEHPDLADAFSDFDHFSEYMNEMTQMDPDSLDTIDDILKFIGHDLIEEEVKAYMYDELFHKGASFEAVWQRCFEDTSAAFAEFSCLEDNLRILMKKLWKSVKSDYKPENDKLKGPLREEYLKIKDSHNRWLRKIVTGNEKVFLSDDLLEIAKLSRCLSEFIIRCNYDFPYEINNFDEALEELKDFEYVFVNAQNDWTAKNLKK